MKVSTEVEIDAQTMEDVLCCGLEGGIQYWSPWMQECKVPKGKALSDFEFWHLGLPLVKGGSIIIAVRDPWEDSDEYGIDPKEVKYVHDPDNGKHELDLAGIERGFQLMADNHPHQFGLIMQDNYDAWTGDLLIQLALFGKEIFG